VLNSISREGDGPDLISSRRMLRRASLWLPPLLYAVAIFHFSSQSEPLPELTAHVWDKLLHAVEYTGLGLLVFRALTGEQLGVWSAALLTILIVSAFGASDEWHQAYVPLRTADVQDWLVDTLGAGLGVIAYFGWTRLLGDARLPAFALRPLRVRRSVTKPKSGRLDEA